MDSITKYIGLDVSKEKIAVAVANEGRGPAQYFGEIPDQIEYIRKVLRKIGDFSRMEVCYEAGPSGYVLKRQLESMGVKCIVVAPSLTPKQPGNRVKTDRRDAVRLAELLRAGELTEVWTPGEEDEALRDLVRAREDAKEDLLRAKHRILKFLQRHGIEKPAGVRPWSTKYCAWLRSLQFESAALQSTFDEYRLALEEIEGRLKRLEDEIHRQAENSVHAPVIKALQALRGVKEVAAASLVAEVGCFSRFAEASQIMAYAGVVPSEYWSGSEVRRGSITKSGDNHLRHILIECAWSYRHKAHMSEAIRKRQEGQPASVRAIAWKAQVRLCQKYRNLVSKGKSSGIAVTAVARELLGFIWAIAREVEQQGINGQYAA